MNDATIGGLMRRTISTTFAITTLSLVVGVSTAGAVSGPGANENSKFVYTEQLAGFDPLVINFDEGSLKRFTSVNYELRATASYVRLCGGQGIGIETAVQDTLLAPVNDEGRATGTFSVSSGSGDTVCGCGCETGTLTVRFTDMTLTNVTTGRVYRLDPLTQTFTS
jgi:hypothetical protein